jgi:hypothetical protein
MFESLTIYDNYIFLDKICRATFKPTVDNTIDYDSQPCSLASGDFNQDNKLDIVVTNSGQDNIGIFLRDDNETLLNQTIYSTGSHSNPYSVVVSDFNQDNFLDIAVANYGTHNIGIFRGKKNGTFANQTTFSTGPSQPIFITVGDFNNDNNQDITVVNYGTNDIGIYLGYGDGTFTNWTTYTTGYDSIPFSLAVADFNNDKKLDIVVANYGTNDIAIFFGYGNGSFFLPVRYTTTPGSHPRSIAVADFNNDQQLDIVVANSGIHNIGIFFGYNNGSFTAQIMYDVGIEGGPEYLTVGDLNNDNETDILMIDSINSHLYILPGYGNGTFFNLTTYITSDGSLPYAAIIGNFNHDYQSDVAVVNYGTNDLLILTVYSIVYSATQTRFSVGLNTHPPSIALGYFNNDQFLDIVVAEFTANSIGVLFGYGNGSFATIVSYSIGNGSAPRCVCTGDFNNDNRSDIVVANYGSHTIGILFGYDNGSFEPMITYSTGYKAFPIFVTAGDFNNDHTLDMAAANFRTSDVAVFLGYGNGSFAEAVLYSTGTGSDPTAIAIADFNNDTYLDLAIANSETSNVGILFGNGDGTFRTPIIPYSTGFQSHPDSIIAGDLNNDHLIDIIVADSTSDYIAILYGYGNGTFEEAIMYTDLSFSNPSGLALGDVDYDNKLDIIVTNFGTNNVGILVQKKNGSFVLGRLYQLVSGSGPKGVVIADINNNTRWDIVVAESGIGYVALLVRYVEAEFQNQTTYSTGSGEHPHSLTIADFNNDNQSDIAVANSGTDNVGVLLGYGNGSFTSQVTYYIELHSEPQYVTVGDFNQDNQVDIATVSSNTDSISVLLGYGNGSFGDITVYSTKVDSQPCWIATGNFNNDQGLDIVVANQGRDNIGILLSYHYNTFKPQETYSNQYSLRPSSIIASDLNNDTYVDIAATFAENDSVGILFGYGNGIFGEIIMYSVGYNSYPYGILDVDVNNDNILDLIVVNSGSNTLGVLLGYGNGTFAPVMIFSTGNDSTPYDVAAGDFNNDNQTDIVVANYHSNNIGILLGYGNGSFATVVIYSTGDGSRPQSVAVSNFNQDNIADIVVANHHGDNVGLFLGNGDGTFQNQITFSPGYYALPSFVIANDFNNDNNMDIAVSNKNKDNVGILYGYGNGTFTSVVAYSIGDGTSPRCIRSGDFNNDKKLDIAVVAPGTNYIVVLYGLGDERFLLGPSFSTGTKSGPISLAVGDFNSDGKLDITTANYLIDNIGVHISYGIQNFGGITSFSTGLESEPSSVAVSDFNNDGRSDVVVANYGTNNIGIFLGHGDGTFASMVPYSIGDNSHPIAVTVGDLNNDNRSDIAVANFQTNNVYILFGYGDGSFSIVSIYPTGTHSSPVGIAITDFNNDSRWDIIIITSGTSSVLLVQGYGNGTFGNETSYALGYNFDPRGIAVGDLDGDNWTDIAVANYGGDFVEILLQTC